MIFRNHLGEISLESDEISVKISTDRRVYIKHKDDKQYKKLLVNNQDYLIPKGYSIREKEAWLWEFRKRYIERINNEPKKTIQEE